ncbi:N-acetylmannosamine-6-phosphate 2-epimerase [Mycoplasmopsis cricetuli]|uniref:N-acetylmannosamine-6-phosphate 2-epimerase n=1 Tax=Mycoplasmopsis cricetuli TaxID=171283 RepID=UPI000471C090|nr:N-acetylmannosamine-6-phosphate 2-epimerase [Mycoplasmopsis cricetuli]
MSIKNGLFIVSVQALKGEPMYGGSSLLKMANAVIQGGAQGLRTSQIKNINDFIKADFKVPIIGIIKKDYKNSDVFITATLVELKKLIATGVDIIAMDATLRKRPKESLEEMVNYFQKYKKPHQKLMADCSNEEDVSNAIKLGFEIIGTTLRGYTEQTKKMSNYEKNYAFLKYCQKLCVQNNRYLIAEGGFDTPKRAQIALKYANAVVVGSAITRPKYITHLFKEKIENGA